MVWTDLTGFPSANYCKRYDQLENYPISFQEHPELNRDEEMLRLFDGNESFVEAEAKLRAFDKHQTRSLELPRHGHGSTSKAEESSETKRSSITRKRTLENAFGGSAKAFGSAVAAIAKDYGKPSWPRQFRLQTPEYMERPSYASAARQKNSGNSYGFFTVYIIEVD